ncbi:MAG: hypothetical protein A4S12_10945 [Proteobacteria bacterium SG_bin5]|nr:helix-turn-helix transcriptional regulator [Sphingomonas sp.]OQW39935.1 MAG: hypothetical protein A4S12_10945 [Proteobacteria bacterium SG_bin5]
MDDPQSFTAPDGTEMVVLTRAEYDRLAALAGEEDALDLAAARAALAESDARYPGPVVDALLEGASPIAAWRRYRGLTQEQLARAAGISQTGIARLERRHGRGFPEGRRATRIAIAEALRLPLSALDPIDERPPSQ